MKVEGMVLQAQLGKLDTFLPSFWLRGLSASRVCKDQIGRILFKKAANETHLPGSCQALREKDPTIPQGWSAMVAAAYATLRSEKNTVPFFQLNAGGMISTP